MSLSPSRCAPRARGARGRLAVPPVLGDQGEGACGKPDPNASPTPSLALTLPSHPDPGPDPPPPLPLPIILTLHVPITLTLSLALTLLPTLLLTILLTRLLIRTPPLPQAEGLAGTGGKAKAAAKHAGNLLVTQKNALIATKPSK